MPTERLKIKIEEEPGEEKKELGEQPLEGMPQQETEGKERMLEGGLEEIEQEIEQFQKSREKPQEIVEEIFEKEAAESEEQKLVKKEKPKKIVEKIFHFFFNPHASEHINYLVENAEKGAIK